MAEAAKNISSIAPITAVKLRDGIKCPWRAGGVQVQEVKISKGERFEEGKNFLWWHGPDGKRVGIPYTNIKQAE